MFKKNAESRNKALHIVAGILVVILIISIYTVMLRPVIKEQIIKNKALEVKGKFSEFQSAAQTVLYENNGVVDDMQSVLNSVLDESNQIAISKEKSMKCVDVVEFTEGYLSKDPWGHEYKIVPLKEGQGIAFISGGPDGEISVQDITANKEDSFGIENTCDDLVTIIYYEKRYVHISYSGFEKYNVIIENSNNTVSNKKIEETDNFLNLFDDFEIEDNIVVPTGYHGEGSSLIVPSTLLIRGNTLSVKLDSRSKLEGHKFGNVCLKGGNVGDLTVDCDAFRNCQVSNLVIGSNCSLVGNFSRSTITKLHIGVNPTDNLFKNTNLKDIELDTNVTEIGSHAFENCRLAKMPDISNISVIKECAFMNAFNNVTMNELRFKEGVEIGNKAFYVSDTGIINNRQYIINLLEIPNNSKVGCEAFRSNVESKNNRINNLIINNNVEISSMAFKKSEIRTLYIGQECKFSDHIFDDSVIETVKIDTNPLEDMFSNADINVIVCLGEHIDEIGDGAFSSYGNINDNKFVIIENNKDSQIKMGENVFKSNTYIKYNDEFVLYIFNDEGTKLLGMAGHISS